MELCLLKQVGPSPFFSYPPDFSEASFLYDGENYYAENGGEHK